MTLSHHAYHSGRSVFNLSLSGRPEGLEVVGGRGKTKTENGALEGGGTLRIADIPSARGSVTDVTDVTVGF